MDELIRKSLKAILKGKLLILGIGNPLKEDDGFGSILARELKGKISATVIDSQGTPENFLEKIVQEKPQTILIVDAADLKEKPASLRLFNPQEIINENYISTHTISLSTLIDFLRMQTSAKILFLGVQPKSLKLKEGLSKELEDRKEELMQFFLDNFSD